MHDGHHGILDHIKKKKGLDHDHHHGHDHHHDHDHHHGHDHHHDHDHARETRIHKIIAATVVIIGIAAYIWWEISQAI